MCTVPGTQKFEKQIHGSVSGFMRLQLPSLLPLTPIYCHTPKHRGVDLQVPVFGLKNSLNVASAGTVALYEVLRQWAAADRLAGAKPRIDGGS